MLLSLSSLFLAFGLSEWPQAWLPYTPALSHPMLIVGLMLVKRLTSGCTEGLAILIIKAEKARIVGLVGAPWQNLLVHPF